MRQCTKCKQHLPDTHFSSRRWINKDGTTSFSKRSRCRDCINNDNLKRFHTNDKTKEAHRKASYKHRLKSYGLSHSEYEELVSVQNNCCAICGASEQRHLSIDHNHSTGKVRALLCNSCNTAIGHARESPELLRKMIDYLEFHK